MPCVCELKIIMRSNAIFWIFSKLWPRTFETQAVVLRLVMLRSIAAEGNTLTQRCFHFALVSHVCASDHLRQLVCTLRNACIPHISITHYTLNLSQICIAHIVPPSMQVQLNSRNGATPSVFHKCATFTEIYPNFGERCVIMAKKAPLRELLYY